jgi:23S rRNA (guanosine2251-2'-O)-methyltransferase
MKPPSDGKRGRDGRGGFGSGSGQGPGPGRTDGGRPGGGRPQGPKGERPQGDRPPGERPRDERRPDRAGTAASPYATRSAAPDRPRHGGAHGGPSHGNPGPGGRTPFRGNAGAIERGVRPSEHAASGQQSDRPRPETGRATLKVPGLERRVERPDQPVHGNRGRDARRGASGSADPRGGPDAPRGAVWLYGLHAVVAALGNPARRLRRLMLTEEAEQAIAAKLPQPWSLAHERTDRARLDHLLGRDVVHQGAALLADPLAPPSLAQIMERSGPLLVLDQVNDPRNVGAILRSAAAFGAAAVITQERNAPEETGALAKAASGALETVPLLRAVNVARTLIALKAAGCWVIGLDTTGTPLIGTALAERRVALVLGSEGDGMRRLTRETCDEVAAIAMPRPDAMDSLNVSAAAAIALYELSRRP